MLFKEALGFIDYLNGKAFNLGDGGSYVPGPGVFEIAKILHLDPWILYLFCF